MNQQKSFCITILVLTLCPAVLSAELLLPKGKISDPVASTQFEGESYAIYLPSNYDPQTKWPILYCFDPEANGSRPVELFRTAAEKYGYIVIGSNKVRANDPSFEIFPSVKAIWEDTHGWFPIDPRRIYATGFSGGARIACNLGLFYKGQVAGVIGCAAGFPPDHPPAKDLPFVYYGTAGNLDFNFQEMMQLDQTLSSLAVAHRIETFDGRHQWPPQDVAVRAVEWMEIQAMKNGSKEKTDLLIDSLYRKRLEMAEAKEKQGLSYDAMIEYEALIKDFQGLKDVSALQPKAAQLEASDAVKDYLKEKEKIAGLESEYAKKTFSALREIQSAPFPLPPAGKIISELEISHLQKEASKPGASQETLMARRMLEQIIVQTTFFLPQYLIEQKDYRRAVFSLSVAAKVDPARPGAWYNIASMYSRCGEKNAALDALQKAVEKGFKDASFIEKDPDFDSLRGERKYQEIIQQIK